MSRWLRLACTLNRSNQLAILTHICFDFTVYWHNIQTDCDQCHWQGNWMVNSWPIFECCAKFSFRKKKLVENNATKFHFRRPKKQFLFHINDSQWKFMCKAKYIFIHLSMWISSQKLILKPNRWHWVGLNENRLHFVIEWKNALKLVFENEKIKFDKKLIFSMRIWAKINDFSAINWTIQPIDFTLTCVNGAIGAMVKLTTPNAIRRTTVW